MRSEVRWGEIAQGGQNAYRDGAPREGNPYVANSVAHVAWAAGWGEGFYRDNRTAPPNACLQARPRELPVLISTAAHRTW